MKVIECNRIYSTGDIKVCLDDAEKDLSDYYKQNYFRFRGGIQG